MNSVLDGYSPLQRKRINFFKLGNYYIIQQAIKELHNVLPNSLIATATKTQLNVASKIDLNIEIKLLAI